MARRKRRWMSGAVNPAHRGALTAKAKAAGMSVPAFAARAVAPGSRASTLTKQQANFARVAARVRRRRRSRS